MHIERLTLLRTLMTEISAQQDMLQHFSLNSWIDIGFGDLPAKTKHAFFNRVEDAQDKLAALLDSQECGTTACACGFAGIDPRFTSQGFRLQCGTPSFDGSSGWSAVQRFFELDYLDACFLFNSEEYEEFKEPTNDPRVVIRHIDHVLAGGDYHDYTPHTEGVAA